jgi:hypothetical protein
MTTQRTLNLLLAMNLLQLNGLKAVEVQKKREESVYLQIANRLKETSRSSNSLFMQINRHLSFGFILLIKTS